MNAPEVTPNNLAYLKLLARQYPSIQSASSAIIHLSAYLHLPKGTEHFMSDIHGEYDAFSHLVRSGSGSIKRKIDETLGGELSNCERRALAMLIYYPRQKLSLLLKEIADPESWFRLTLLRLIRLCRLVSSKYPRVVLRQALPVDFAGIIEELLHEQESVDNKPDYYNNLLDTIISLGSAEAFVIALCELIQRLEIAHLHILGDIYDRGPGAHRIVDDLMRYHSVDIQWGNHDMLWMGAAAGSEACIASVIRICLRYGNLQTLEDGYAINLLPLVTLAMDVYRDDPCRAFDPHLFGEEEDYSESELRLMAQMHKAITIIQLKLEGQVIHRRPEYKMNDRLLLDKIDFDHGTVHLNGAEYPLLDIRFPTIDPHNPYELTEGERAVIDKLKLSFLNSEKLQTHMHFLLNQGSMYQIYNGNLLYHGCIPLNPDGSFVIFKENGNSYGIQEYLDLFDRLVRQGYLAEDSNSKLAGLDAMWYLWSGPLSPLFGKAKMATFERYFIAVRSTHEEKKNPYYDYRDQETTATRILQEFGLDPQGAHIINGHVPVKVRRGESPIKAGGKLLVIDGGFTRAYQQQTGIAGYTLVYNSFGLLLASHEPFKSTQKAIEDDDDFHSQTIILETNTQRIRVRDTDAGRRLQHQIADLHALLSLYRSGVIKEGGDHHLEAIL